DHLAETVRPALEAVGADLDRVTVFDRVKFADQPLALPGDLPEVEAAVAEVQARLVVVDPLTAFLDGDANSDRSVRRTLARSAAFGDRPGVAVLLVRHLTKAGSRSPLYRGAGSIAIIAAARSALLAADDPASDDPYRHVLALSKGNLSPAASLAYRTVDL